MLHAPGNLVPVMSPLCSVNHTVCQKQNELDRISALSHPHLTVRDATLELRELMQ